jgi:hypothetical protein
MCNVRRSHSIDSLVSYNDIGAWKLKVAKQTASILVDPHDIVRGTGYKKVNDLPVSLTIEVETIDLIPPW